MSIEALASRFNAVMGELISPRPFEDWSLNGNIHPCFISHGRGGHLIDSEGNEYIDWLSGWGTNILGHNYPKVIEAVKSQLEIGPNLGLVHSLGIEVAELLCELVPCAEKVSFGKNGSDATEGAVRLARAVTGRERILIRGYHGFHDWYMASDSSCKGIPSCLRKLIDHIPYNDLAGVDQKLREFPGTVAAIIIDPVTVPLPKPGFLEGLIELAHKHGALVIFDEVVTGLRLAPGGAQEYYKVTPDLACFSKGIANGLPLSVLLGKKKYMQHLLFTKFGMTFGWEALSLAAAKATITEIRDKNVCKELWRIGGILQREYRQIADQFNVSTEIAGTAPRAQLQFKDQGGVPEHELRWLFIQELAKDSIITPGTFMICYSHTEEDIKKTIASFRRIMRIIQQAIDRGSAEGLMNQNLYNSMKADLAQSSPQVDAQVKIHDNLLTKIRRITKNTLPYGFVRRVQMKRAKRYGEQ